jgi:hypothetical protein
MLKWVWWLLITEHAQTVLRLSARINTDLAGSSVFFTKLIEQIYCHFRKLRSLGWRIALLVGGSRNRYTVTGDFFWGIREFHVPWGRLSL